MLKLLKYEFIKIFNAVLIVLGAVTLLEAMYGIGAVLMKNNDFERFSGDYTEYYDSIEYILYSVGSQMYSFATVLLLILVFSAAIFVIIFSLVTMNNDFCKKQGYNVFLTPNSAFAILGAKYITSFVIFVLYGLIAFLLIVADINITSWLYDEDYIRIFEDIIWPLIEETGVDLFAFFLEVAAQLTYYIVLAGFTLIFTQTVLKVTGGVKVILQFVVFGLINSLSSTAMILILSIASQTSSFDFDSSTTLSEAMNGFFYVTAFAYIAISVLFYFLSARLIEKKLSL